MKKHALILCCLLLFNYFLLGVELLQIQQGLLFLSKGKTNSTHIWSLILIDGMFKVLFGCSVLNNNIRFVSCKKFLFFMYQHGQRNKAAGAVVAAAKYYDRDGTLILPVDLGMLREAGAYVSRANRADLPATEKVSAQIKHLTSIFMMLLLEVLSR